MTPIFTHKRNDRIGCSLEILDSFLRQHGGKTFLYVCFTIIFQVCGLWIQRDLGSNSASPGYVTLSRSPELSEPTASHQKEIPTPGFEVPRENGNTSRPEADGVPRSPFRSSTSAGVLTGSGPQLPSCPGWLRRELPGPGLSPSQGTATCRPLIRYHALASRL